MTDTGRKNQNFKEKVSTGEAMRLNKFLSDAGVCSRRQADRYVEQGDDGVPAELAQTVGKTNRRGRFPLTGGRRIYCGHKDEPAVRLVP